MCQNSFKVVHELYLRQAETCSTLNIYFSSKFFILGCYHLCYDTIQNIQRKDKVEKILLASLQLGGVEEWLF